MSAPTTRDRKQVYEPFVLSRKSGDCPFCWQSPIKGDACVYVPATYGYHRTIAHEACWRDPVTARAKRPAW